MDDDSFSNVDAHPAFIQYQDAVWLYVICCMLSLIKRVGTGDYRTKEDKYNRGQRLLPQKLCAQDGRQHSLVIKVPRTLIICAEVTMRGCAPFASDECPYVPTQCNPDNVVYLDRFNLLIQRW